MDDNVHIPNTVRLAYELEKADKQFDVMIYPKSRHGVTDHCSSSTCGNGCSSSH